MSVQAPEGHADGGVGLRTEPSRVGAAERESRRESTSLSRVWLTSQRILSRPTSHIPALRVTAANSTFYGTITRFASVGTVTATQDSVPLPPTELPLAALSRDVSIPSAQRAAVFVLSFLKERSHGKRSFMQTCRAPSHLRVPCKC